MPGPAPSKQLAILERRKQVASLYLRGESQWEIARAVGTGQSQVHRDLAAIRQEWLESAIRDFDGRKAEELARIDRLEAIAWKAWERSCQDAETHYTGTETGRTGKAGEPLPDRSKTWTTLKGQAGDPRFLERVAWCIDQRCKITGLLKASLDLTTGGQPFKVYLGVDVDRV